jgi:hypothetical protein
MSNLYQSCVALVLGAMLAACGGGSSDPAALSSNPTPGAAPTAAIADSSAAATALATEAMAAADAARKASLAQGIGNPFTLAGGVVTTIACPAGGDISYDVPNAMGAGTVITVSFNSCSFAAGSTATGSVSIQIGSFVDQSNLTFSTTYEVAVSGTENLTLGGSQTCSIVADVITCVFSEGGRTFEGSFTYDNGVANGSYQWTYPNAGTVKFTFVNWTDTSGTIQVTGANGTTATIVRTSATTFTVTINSGTPRIITLG